MQNQKLVSRIDDTHINRWISPMIAMSCGTKDEHKGRSEDKNLPEAQIVKSGEVLGRNAVVAFSKASPPVVVSKRAPVETLPGTMPKEKIFDLGQSVCGLCKRVVSMALCVPLADLQSPHRCNGDTALARQIAMYLAHTSFSLRMTEIGIHFGRDRSTVSHACAIVEDKRDKHSFDLTLSQLEALLADARGAIDVCLEATTTCEAQVPVPTKPKLCDKLLPIRELHND